MHTLQHALTSLVVAVRPTKVRGTLRATLTRYSQHGRALAPHTFVLTRAAGWEGCPSAERVLRFLVSVGTSVADDFPIFLQESGLSRSQTLLGEGFVRGSHHVGNRRNGLAVLHRGLGAGYETARAIIKKSGNRK